MNAEVQTQGPAWDLSTEYTSVEDSQLLADIAAMDELLNEVALLNPGLDTPHGVEKAQQIAKLSEQAGTLLSNISTFAHCLLSVDSQHDGAQKLNGQLQAYRKRFGDLFEPLSQFVDAASDEVVAQYLDDPEVSPSAFLVHHGRERRHENLSLSEESLVNGLSQDGIHAWGNLYDQLSGTLQCEVLVGNATQSMGVAQASGLLNSADDHQRKAAWQGINNAWEAQDEACAAGLNAMVGWRLEMCNQRSRHKPVHFLDAPVHMNRISRGTLDTLLEAAFQAKPLAQKAAKLQARAYGKEGFGPWDLRAPAPTIEQVQAPSIEFDEAIDLIARAYGEVDASMEKFVRMMVANNWIEGTVGPRKTPGAYCTGFAKSRTPRIYMTYTGGQSDVITLAHELGHALHSWVMRDLPESQRSYGMSLAETASTFGETLVRDTLLAQSSSKQERLDILWEEMSAFTAFLLNIPARYEFERKFYEARAARPLRPQEMKDLMSEAWRSWYGDSLAEPDPMFWASKLHFYISGLSFYNFPYLFGYLFSLGVYSQRDAFGDQFYQKYVALLRDTGRMSAEDLAQTHLGVALDKPDFWQATIDSLSSRVSAFEAILEEVGR
ncbi:MAG: M3 family oligoendopeptidase [Gammaproteobacteria bacterium]|nr:M3 family oligoendopeptidase [Gammaproteobacteria bacterium]